MRIALVIPRNSKIGKKSFYDYKFIADFTFSLVSLLFSLNVSRSRFILKILPKVFYRRVRISTILTLMAYNDYAFTP